MMDLIVAGVSDGTIMIRKKTTLLAHKLEGIARCGRLQASI